MEGWELKAELWCLFPDARVSSPEVVEHQPASASLPEIDQVDSFPDRPIELLVIGPVGPLHLALKFFFSRRDEFVPDLDFTTVDYSGPQKLDGQNSLT